jgi:hypothetical protein
MPADARPATAVRREIVVMRLAPCARSAVVWYQCQFININAAAMTPLQVILN